MKKNLIISVLIFSIFHFPFSVFGQVRPVYDYGAIGFGQLLKKLNNTKSVMMIGAHPDDEDSALLAYLARGENARTAYLSLTRGDGGQNLLGDELFESLGVIRTEELLQARRLDGAEQYFTRAFDYGFSKTLDEAKSKWDEKIVLCDAVRAIRNFRPLVVISRFSGTPADGHGQHQFAGYISPIAVKAAADQTQCKDAGLVWNVKKFYVGQGFRSTNEPSLKINTGEYDLLLGRSYAEIAAEGRSQHKTQEQGGLELKGDRFSGLNLISDEDSITKNETNIFDGIDVSIKGISEITNNREETVAQKISRLQEITDKLKFEDFGKENLLTLLAQGWKAANDAEWSTRQPQTKFFLQQKQKEFIEAIKLAAGLQIDALANKETVAAGEEFLTTVKIFYPENPLIKIKEINFQKNNWQIAKTEAPKEENQNIFRRETGKANTFFTVKVPADARPTAPYWLDEERGGYLFEWNKNDSQTLPFDPPLLSAEIKIAIGDNEIVLNEPVEYRFADDIRGEIRRELNVVPAISLSLDQKILIVPQSDKTQKKRIVMSLTNNSQSPVRGVVSLNSNSSKELNYTASSKTFELKSKGEKTAINFDVEIPPSKQAEEFEIYGQAMIGEALATLEMQTISYPHIQTHRIYKRAVTQVKIFDLKVEPVKVGYITGSGDKVPQAIEKLGLDAAMLDENDLATGDLSRFDTIVVGIRASQARPDFVANHQRLLEYVRNGGTLIVQYQLPVYQNLLPFPAQMNARVTDENAKVTILDPAHPVFNFPNKISEKDFENWVQERNLYSFSTFDANYKPLLESHDAGEAENKGGLVVAEIGKGKYLYCSYALFRQLPAGVSGAYRLLANLLSLPKSKN